MEVIDTPTLIKLTGYRQPAKQLAELHRQGFWRARRCPVTGHVILERPHYDAVSRGSDQTPSIDRPKLHRPTLKAA